MKKQNLLLLAGAGALGYFMWRKNQLKSSGVTGIAGYNYYASQLAKIEVGKSEYSPKIKIFANGNGDDTNFIDLNSESAKELIKWLKRNFK